MTDTPEQSLAPAKELALTAQERAATRHMLEVFSHTYTPRPNPARVAWSFFHRHAAASFAVFALLFLGGVSGLAQSALPDGLLYPVKTGVNDRVRSAFTFNEDSKIDAELQLIDQSLSEEQQIADRDLQL